MSVSAVVFGYGDVGVRCTGILLDHGVDIPLVVTHEDDPNENRWYASLAELAVNRGLPCATPASPDAALIERVRGIAPDFIFSFYYRNLLPDALLSAARRGALNIHGSLLPRFRGRAPINWAVLRGATETGATLHYMVGRADAGDIVDQAAVPILEDDDAHAVFHKVLGAAQLILKRSLPLLIAGTAPRRRQDLDAGEYVGRRRPEDGRINWSRPAREIHNLVRAVAPPFPGAFTAIDGERWIIARTRLLHDAAPVTSTTPRLRLDAGRCIADCADGRSLEVLDARRDGGGDLATLADRLARAPLRPG